MRAGDRIILFDILAWALLFLHGAGIYYFIVDYPYLFNYELWVYHYSVLPGFLALLLILIIFFSIRLRVNDQIRPTDVYFYPMPALLIALCFSSYYSFHNEYFSLVVLLYLSLSLSMALFKEIHIKIIAILLTAFFLVEIVIGIYQIGSLLAFDTRRSLRIQGTFRNSGIYSVYLVLCIPIFFYTLYRMGWRGRLLKRLGNPVFRHAAFVIIIAAVFLILCYTWSRTGLLILLLILGSLANSIFKAGWIGKYRLYILKSPLLVATLLSFAAIVGYLIVRVKYMSSVGRWLGLKIAALHFNDRLLFGIGLGRFTREFPQWQSEFFRQRPYIYGPFYRAADETYLLFNEPVQYLKEIGLVAWLAVVFGLYRMLRRTSRTGDGLTSTGRIIILSTVAAGCTTYVFHCSILLYLAFLGGLMLSAQSNGSKHAMDEAPVYVTSKIGAYKWLLPVVILLSAGIASFYSVRIFAGVQEWRKISAEGSTRKEMKDGYASIAGVFCQNGKFMYEYANFLAMDSNDCREALKLLKDGQRFFLSYEYMNKMASIYTEAGEDLEAAACYRWLTFFVPNRFQPKIDLLRTYVRLRDSANVRDLARVIISMPQKIPSPVIATMKAEATDILKNYNTP